MGSPPPTPMHQMHQISASFSGDHYEYQTNKFRLFIGDNRSTSNTKLVSSQQIAMQVDALVSKNNSYNPIRLRKAALFYFTRSICLFIYDLHYVFWRCVLKSNINWGHVLSFNMCGRWSHFFYNIISINWRLNF